jgi:hypothetical protein
VARVDDMNIEWVETSVKISQALLTENYFTAWDLSRRLHEELEAFTTEIWESRRA